MNFSVLMSIYFKEKPEYFDRAMQSIWDEQTVKPNEIILVQDGELTEDLYKVIANWQDKLQDVLKTIPLKENVGLGDALNEGIKHCSMDLIARMDTDDIAISRRFEKQLKIFENNSIDISSGWVSEFESDEKQIVSFRKLPENHDEIVEYAKRRSPLNHPAVMYKKSAVEKAGGYQKMMWFEDYYLWARMLLNGSKFHNIQEPLVNMRAGYGQLERRGGLKYAVAEFNFFKTLYSKKFFTLSLFLQNILIRFIARVLPKKILKLIYKKLRS
jgi:glycosyltransferase involved in cell wall biosynthesis